MRCFCSCSGIGLNKRSPFNKRPLIKVLKLSVKYCKYNLPPLLSCHGHPFGCPNEGYSIHLCPYCMATQNLTHVNCVHQEIGPMHDPVTWYGINYAGMQVTPWNFQNKGKSSWTGTSSFVLEVPLCNLHPSIINSVQCDQILQRAY